MGKLLKTLIDIQQRLDAPKDKYNSFGKYKYRSLEGIESAIKPLLKEHGCGIWFNDEVVERCGRTFLKTTLHFFNADGEEMTTTAEAEHAPELKGMDKSQITGAASSYARKYAMNGLFAIDDTSDADTDEFHNQTTAPAPVPQTTQKPAATTRTRKAAPAPVPQTPPVPQIQQVPQTPQVPQTSSAPIQAKNVPNFATSQIVGTFIPIVPNDRYGGIKNALNAITTKTALLALYNQHKNEVDNNPEIKALFAERKSQLNIA